MRWHWHNLILGPRPSHFASHFAPMRADATVAPIHTIYLCEDTVLRGEHWLSAAKARKYRCITSASNAVYRPVVLWFVRSVLGFCTPPPYKFTYYLSTIAASARPPACPPHLPQLPHHPARICGNKSILIWALCLEPRSVIGVLTSRRDVRRARARGRAPARAARAAHLDTPVTQGSCT
eukprot:COSAG02_NODE_1019_length_15171_cov_7.663482_14_plen_179_part_00